MDVSMAVGGRASGGSEARGLESALMEGRAELGMERARMRAPAARFAAAARAFARCTAVTAWAPVMCVGVLDVWMWRS